MAPERDEMIEDLVALGDTVPDGMTPQEYVAYLARLPDNELVAHYRYRMLVANRSIG